MANGPKIFVGVDDGSIESLKQKVKELRGDTRAAQKDLNDLRATGQQVSREVMQKVETAQAQLKIASKDLKEAKEVLDVSKEGYHFAHTTEKLAHKAEKLLSNRFAQALMSGGNIGGKDLIREFLFSDKLIKGIAKKLGAGESIITGLGSAGVVGTAALMGYEIGEKIRENLDEWTKLRESASNKKGPAEKVKDLLEGQQWWGKGVEEALGLSGSRARKEAFESVEKYATEFEGLSAGEITGALNTSSRHAGENRTLLEWMRGKNKTFVSRSQIEKQAIEGRNSEVAQNIATALRKAEEKRTSEIGQPLTKEQLEEVFQSVTAEFIKSGDITPTDLTYLHGAHERVKKIKNVNELYEERRQKEVYEANLAAYERRVPWSPMD